MICTKNRKYSLCQHFLFIYLTIYQIILKELTSSASLSKIRSLRHKSNFNFRVAHSCSNSKRCLFNRSSAASTAATDPVGSISAVTPPLL